MDVKDFTALLYLGFILALKIPLEILAFFASLYPKKERIQPSLFQRLTAVGIKSVQVYAPLWFMRKLISQFMGMSVSNEQRMRWVKKLDVDGGKDGWEAYLIANNAEYSEPGKDADMIILYAHGGGFVCGDALGPLKMFIDWINEWKLSYGVKTQIVSLEYGLAPENPFPTARDSMIACYEWLINEKKISPSKIALAGDSAGATTTLVAAIHLINQLRIDPPAALILLSPCVSAVGNSKSFSNNAPYDIINPIWFSNCLEAYLGDSQLLSTCPLISPLFENNLSGLPKVWAGVGGYEMFVDDVVKFFEKLMANNIKSELVIEDTNFHDYSVLKILSRDGGYENSIKRIGKFLYL